MILKELFDYINQLNDIYKKFNSLKEYSLKFAPFRTYEELDCFKQTYINLNDFEKAIEEETYYTNIGSVNVELLQSEYDLEDCQFKVHFEGVLTNTNEKVEQNCYIFIRSTYIDEF